MTRNKSKNDKKFNCSQEHELMYESELHVKNIKVYNYLKKEYEDNTVNEPTHIEISKKIEEDLDL